MFYLFFLEPSQSNDVLSKTITDAYTRLCHVPTEEYHMMQNVNPVMLFQNMSHEQTLFHCAAKLTSDFQQITEFAKMIPGFRRLSRDDQIVLLKAGSLFQKLEYVQWNSKIYE